MPDGKVLKSKEYNLSSIDLKNSHWLELCDVALEIIAGRVWSDEPTPDEYPNNISRFN